MYIFSHRALAFSSETIPAGKPSRQYVNASIARTHHLWTFFRIFNNIKPLATEPSVNTHPALPIRLGLMSTVQYLAIRFAYGIWIP